MLAHQRSSSSAGLAILALSALGASAHDLLGEEPVQGARQMLWRPPRKAYSILSKKTTRSTSSARAS